MTDDTPGQWAREFRSDLILDGERVPFDRVLTLHADRIAKLRSKGLTWVALANLLRRASVLRGDGKPYSADHLRVSYSRLRRKSPIFRNDDQGARHAPAPSPSASLALYSEPPASFAPLRLPAAKNRGPVATSAETDKDVSDEEITLALTRLEKLKP